MVDVLTNWFPYNSILKDVLFKQQRIFLLNLICQDFPVPFEYIKNSISAGKSFFKYKRLGVKQITKKNVK